MGYRSCMRVNPPGGSRRPVARPPRGLVRPGRAPRRRLPWLVALGVTVAVVVTTFAIAVSSEERPRPAGVRGGITDRTSFLLISGGRSRAEVRAALGEPRAKRPAVGDRGASGECWVYGARSGRPITYELCFAGGFLRSRAILPHAVGQDRAVVTGRPLARLP